jgi:hypothetical protein
VVETALPTRIIDTVNTTPNTPGLPEPLQFGDILPSFSAGIVVQEAQVRQFYPIVNRAYLTQWSGNRGENDCQPMPALAEPAAPTRAWSTSIPARNSWTNRQWFGGYNDPWPAAFPTRLLLIGQFDSPGHVQHGNSFVLGGFARWQSCETRTPFLQEYFTSYVLSYNAPIADWPRMRHYRLWKKLGEISAPDGTQITQTFSWTKGVSTTEASEFTASVSVTAGAAGPTAYAELTATVTQTLSQSITFTADELRSVAFTADRTQRPEYKLQYSVWALVDRYVIEGSVPGTPWSDPNYELSSSNAASFRFDHVSDTTFAIQSAWFLR